ncbi:PASTA domain-containing protein [Nonomuraea sp. NPDC050643]|uniref:PASTA domain-containing protein n=1 Tax=Nonomuraea sp. NPDC050643 TaxID=3155660 RepID=UPI0033C84CCE
MTIEDELADAMKAHVAGVQAAPDLGRSVRRRHRAHVLRFRVGGAALLTVAVAAAVPVVVNSSEPATTPNAASGQDRAVMLPDVTVPDVTGKRGTEAAAILRQAGLVTSISGAEVRDGRVTGQEPAAGLQVAHGSHVSITIEPPVQMPQDLGDLGDGREFGGIRLDYLPEGLEWGKWSGKDGFGKHSYTTSFVKPGAEPGHYAVQAIVFEGEATEQLFANFPKKDAEAFDAGGRQAWLATLSEGGEAVAHGSEGGTLTILLELRDGLAVEVCVSPDYAKEVDGAVELKKIAEGVRAIK